MITKALYDKLHHLATLTKITHNDGKELEAAIKMYINPRYSVCLRCVQQLKHGQKLILNWLSAQTIIETLTGVNMEETLMEEIIPLETEPQVDVVEAEKVGCAKCGRKKKIKS